MRRAVTVLAALALVAVSVVAPLPAPASVAAHGLGATIPMPLYVATDGDDAALCTAIDAPCLTVSGGVARAQAAIADGVVDVTVHIAAGTYNENVAIGAVASGHSLTLLGAGQFLTVIDGLGSAATPASVITVASGIVSIGSLSVTGGYAQNGGGIHNAAGTLTISDATVTGNTATTSGGSTDKSGGGGIYNATGTVTISDSVVSGNTTTATLGSFKGGGGIYNATGAVSILHSGVTNNTVTGTGGYGGGVFGLDGGTITIADSTVSNNTSKYYAGGINNLGLLVVSRSTVSNNIAELNFGGGISNYNATLVLFDSTLSGNSATAASSGKGGAIYNKGFAAVINATLHGNSATFGGGIASASSGNLTITHTTLSNNTATRSGGGLYLEAGTIAVSNSVLSASSCSVSSAISDGGYNVSDSCTFHVPIGTSITGSTTIGLAPLAENGSTGPLTMAIDSTSSAHHLVPGCAGTDARGLARPGFGEPANCDAGAYEIQRIAPAVTTDPLSQTFAIAADATFTAAASGTPTPTVQWQSYTGTAWVDVPDATATTLTVAGVTHAMSGAQYRAVFTNGAAPDATTAVATMTVPVGALHHLVLSPSSGTFVVGGSQTFTAEGFDSFDNSRGDVPGTTVFTGSAGLECSAARCTSTVPGTYTVTGTDGVATGSATVTVAGIPEVPLPTNKPAASGSLAGVPTTTQPGARFTATATGFAPHAPVTFGIYSTPFLLGTAIADSNGTAVVQLQIPVGLTGSHTVVAAGMSPSQTARYLEAQVFVELPVPTAGPTPGLAVTGADADLSQLGAMGFLLLLLGSTIGLMASRRHRTAGRTPTAPAN